VEIDGKKKNLNKRKYCLDCSPFGSHNTKNLSKKLKDEYKCACGETRPEKFYGIKKSVCSKCHKEYTLRIGQEKRKKAIDYLGGECKNCGYDKYYGAIDLHHLDPRKKDSDFNNLRGWSWERIKKEIKNCVPLCATCHREVHAGVTKIE
jgi:hypothetical protein